MKTSTYGFLVLMTFAKNVDVNYCDSIKDLIEITDILAKKLGCNSDLCFMTKYNVVKNLIDEGLLVVWKKGKVRRIRLAKHVKDYLLDAMNEHFRTSNTTL